MKAESLLLVREVGSGCPLFFVLGLRRARIGQVWDQRGAAHRVLWPISSGQVPVCSGLTQRLGYGPGSRQEVTAQLEGHWADSGP